MPVSLHVRPSVRPSLSLSLPLPCQCRSYATSPLRSFSLHQQIRPVQSKKAVSHSSLRAGKSGKICDQCPPESNSLATRMAGIRGIPPLSPATWALVTTARQSFLPDISDVRMQEYGTCGFSYSLSVSLWGFSLERLLPRAFAALQTAWWSMGPIQLYRLGCADSLVEYGSSCTG